MGRCKSSNCPLVIHGEDDSSAISEEHEEVMYIVKLYRGGSCSLCYEDTEVSL